MRPGLRRRHRDPHRGLRRRPRRQHRRLRRLHARLQEARALLRRRSPSTLDHENCDDGVNLSEYGGCGPGCVAGPSCGDGIVQSKFEQCDDGVLDGKYGGCARAVHPRAALR